MPVSWDNAFETIFTGLILIGGGAGISRLFYVRSTNKSIKANSGKTTAEATAIFSNSILTMLTQAQETARQAQHEASLAHKKATLAEEEAAFLRRWIIEQGLVPPSPSRVGGN